MYVRKENNSRILYFNLFNGYQWSFILQETPEISSTEEDAKKKIYGALHIPSNHSPIVECTPSSTNQPNLTNLSYHQPLTLISISDPDHSQ